MFGLSNRRKRRCWLLRQATAFCMLALIGYSSATPMTSAVWRCPDGRACVLEPGKGYCCPNDFDGVARSCCQTETMALCDHNHSAAFPKDKRNSATVSKCSCHLDVTQHSRVATTHTTRVPTPVALIHGVLDLAPQSSRVSVAFPAFRKNTGDPPPATSSRAPPSCV